MPTSKKKTEKMRFHFFIFTFYLKIYAKSWLTPDLFIPIS